jgi:hypothetical protein
MTRPIENSNSTDKAIATGLGPGRYLINLSCPSGSTAVVSLYRRIKDGEENDMVVATSGTVVQLTVDDSAKELTIGAEDIVVQRANGVDIITVEFTKLPEWGNL